MDFEKLILMRQLIESKQDEVKRLRYLAASLSGVDNTGEKVRSSGNTKCRHAELIDKAVDLENEILEDINRMLDYQREVGEAIDSLPNQMWRLVMRDLYIDGLTAGETAKRRGISIRTVQNYKREIVHLLSRPNAL